MKNRMTRPQRRVDVVAALVVLAVLVVALVTKSTGETWFPVVVIALVVASLVIGVVVRTRDRNGGQQGI